MSALVGGMPLATWCRLPEQVRVEVEAATREEHTAREAYLTVRLRARHAREVECTPEAARYLSALDRAGAARRAARRAGASVQ